MIRIDVGRLTIRVRKSVLSEVKKCIYTRGVRMSVCVCIYTIT